MSLFPNFDVVLDKKAKSLSYYVRSPNPSISMEDIEELVSLSIKKGHVDARICLHRNPSDFFHQMIIVHHKGRYRRPHRELNKQESYHMIQGEMAVFLFDQIGKVKKIIIQSKKKNVVFRNNLNKWHVVYPLSPYVVFEELKQGPFRHSKDIQYPEWAPDGRDEKENKVYMKKLLKTLKLKI